MTAVQRPRTEACDSPDRYAAEYGAASPSGLALRSRLKHVANLLAPCRGGTVLDVGAGPGMIIPEVVKRDYRYVGVDISLGMVRRCKQAWAAAGLIEVLVGRAEALPFPDASFDVVLCLGALEYCDDPTAAVREIARVVKGGGVVILSMLNKHSPYRVWERVVKARAAGLLALKTHAEPEFRRLCEAQGLIVTDLLYFDFNVFPWPLDVYYPRWQARVEERLEPLAATWLKWLGTVYLVRGIKLAGPVEKAGRASPREARDRDMRTDAERNGVALLTPYGGRNMGDGAIQQAAIEHLRATCPGRPLFGVTLDPVETEKRHGIPCYPLHGFTLAWYATTRSSAEEGAPAGALWQRAEASIRQVVRAVKAVPGGRGLVRLMRRLVDLTVAVGQEARHMVASYKLLSNVRLLVVSGGGQLDEEWGGPWGHPYALLKWAVLARLAGVRVVVLSLGVGQLGTRLSRLFVRWALSLAAYRSWRDTVSKHMLAWLPWTREDPCVPDLVFGLDVTTYQKALRRDRTPRVVGVSPIAYGHPTNWPQARPENYQRYLRELGGFVVWLVEQGYHVVLFATSGFDRRIVRELIDLLKAQTSGGIMDAIHHPGVDTLDQLLVQLSQVEMVVASRLHGVLLSHLLHKPAVAVSFDRKVGTHMADVGQERFCLEIDTVTTDQLIERFQMLDAESQSLRRTLAGHVARFRLSVEQQFQALAKL